MTDFNIPMEAARATIGSGAETPLQVDTRIPMAVKPFEPIDPIAATAQAYKLLDTDETFREKQAENLELQQIREEKARDKQVLDQYSKSGGDLYSPEGLKRAMADLKGKVSSKSFMNLGELTDKKQVAEVQMKRNLLSLDDEAFDQSLKRQSVEMQNIAGVVGAYDQGMKQGGEQAANVAFEKAKQETITRLSQEKDASGNPAHKPEELQRYAQMDYPTLKNELQNSAWGLKVSKQAAEERLKDAQSRREDALADKAASEVGVAAKKADAALEKAGKSGDLLSEEDLPTVAEQVRLNGVTVLSRYGLSPAQRKQVLSKVTELNNSDGISAREGATAVTFAKSDAKSLDKLVPQYDAITAYENTMGTIGEKLKQITRKVDSTGMPVFERWVRAGRKAVQGDPDVSELDARMRTFTTEAARTIMNPNLTGVLSDSARKEIEDMIPKGASADQVDRAVDVLMSEARTRSDNLDKQIKDVKGRISQGAATSQTQIDPSEQKDRDVEAGRMRVREVGGVAGAKKEVAQIDEALKTAKGDAKKILEQERKMWQAGIDAESGVLPVKVTAGSKPKIVNW